MVLKTFKDAYKQLKGQTNYERKNNISGTGKEEIIEFSDMKLLIQERTDKSHSGILFFKSSTEFDNWLYWTLSKGQMNDLEKVYMLFQKIDKGNE